MRLDGALGGAKLESDLFVNLATDDTFENLSLPWRQFGNEERCDWNRKYCSRTMR